LNWRSFNCTKAHLYAAIPKPRIGARLCSYCTEPFAADAIEEKAAVLEFECFSKTVGLTKPAETAIREKHLLVQNPWSPENFRLYLTLLCEEITERTPQILSVVDWHESGAICARIKVPAKTTG
jgi:hypothetical protein